MGRGAADRGKDSVGVREGFLVVSLTWLVAAVLGALPYVLSGEDQISSPIDAYFEAMSGFTTTGATVLTDIEAMPDSLLIWRQLTQWLGGMGIIVLALAVLPRLRVGGRQLLEHELRARVRADDGPDPRHRAAALGSLRRADVAMVLILSVFGWTGSTTR